MNNSENQFLKSKEELEYEISSFGVKSDYHPDEEIYPESKSQIKEQTENINNVLSNSNVF